MSGLWWKLLVGLVGLLVGLNSIGISMPWAISARLDAVEVRLGRIETALDRLATPSQAHAVAAHQDPAPSPSSVGSPAD